MGRGKVGATNRGLSQEEPTHKECLGIRGGGRRSRFLGRVLFNQKGNGFETKVGDESPNELKKLTGDNGSGLDFRGNSVSRNRNLSKLTRSLLGSVEGEVTNLLFNQELCSRQVNCRCTLRSCPAGGGDGDGSYDIQDAQGNFSSIYF